MSISMPNYISGKISEESMYLNMTRGHTYSQIYMAPKKSICESRSLCDTSLKLGNIKFEMPIVASNMKSVVDQNTCIFFAEHGWFYVMHRFGTDNVEFVDMMHAKGHFASISIGISEDSYKCIDNIAEYCSKQPEYVTIDIANAYYDRAVKMMKYVKEELPESFLIAGNVATIDGAKFLEDAGADALRVGIACGKPCTTKNQTGFHVPMVESVYDCSHAVDIPVIADGGATDIGDVAKALALGAEMVMCGSLFAGYDQSAGDIIDLGQNGVFKEYFGSASEFNKDKAKNVEGRKILINYRGDMNRFLDECHESLQSSISYSGGLTLESLREDPVFYVV